jgi:hypothetical protein
LVINFFNFQELIFSQSILNHRFYNFVLHVEVEHFSAVVSIRLYLRLELKFFFFQLDIIVMLV